MKLTEKTYWNACPVKNYGSILYLLPNGNVPAFKGPFIDSIGLARFNVDGKAVAFKPDETMYRHFDYGPGRVQAVFDNYICPFLVIEEELVAAGDESYRLCYIVRNKSRERREVELFFDMRADRKLESVEQSGTAVSLNMDLNKKQVKAGQGISDFTYLFEWYIEDKDFRIGFTYPESEFSRVANKQVVDGVETVLSEGGSAQACGDDGAGE